MVGQGYRIESENVMLIGATDRDNLWQWTDSFMNELKTNIKPEHPEPIRLDKEPYSVNNKSGKRIACDLLLSGEYVMVEDAYPTGLNVLAKLKKKVFGDKSKNDFKAYRDKRSEYYRASNLLLTPIKNNKIALRKSPDIGWLASLYPDTENFILPFPQLQGLNSSWQWYIKGILYPVLNQKIHPYYGTYFPTRFDHLKLFDDWLKKFSGKKDSAFDIGAGCGVLSFQLLNRGFGKVYATDINPNAIISVIENAKNFGLEDRLMAWQSDLFEVIDRKANLIVFNPPWLPAQQEITGLDRAIYHKPDLFERFFKDAGNYITEGGKIVLLFSNLGLTTGMQTYHPIKEEMRKHRRFKKIKHIRKKVAGPSGKTRRKNHRENEYAELWELKAT